jgi:diguanylate cyclase (GGDEF)-like protein
MSRIAEHLAELTGHRDRDMLDVSLAAALKDLLRPAAIAVHRAVGEPGRQRWITRARLGAADQVADADSLWAELESLPTLEDQPALAQCLAGDSLVELAGPPRTTLFPITTEREPVGVLEITSVRSLAADQCHLVFSVLRIFRNFQGLLDYSERDTLTGLLNRKTFDESFLRAALSSGAAATSPVVDARRRRGPAIACLGVIDIDHFKRVNDSFGHLIGDEVLLLMSRLMRSSFRFRDPLFRYGGEEFVVLMRCARRADAAAAFERLRATVERYAFPRVGHITVSIGFTEIRTGDTPTGCFERADKAVYHAKQSGRNQVRDHDLLVAQGVLIDEAHMGDVELF